MARPKSASRSLDSIEDCTRAMRELLTVTLDQERLEADRDQAAAGAMKPFEARIARAAEQRADLEQQLQTYYLTHLKEIEQDGRKSVALTYGIMGRRQTPSSLRLLNRAWTWVASLAKLQGRYGLKFIRVAEPEIDKEKVKAEIPEGDLAEFGLKLHQEEKFYIDLVRAEQEGS